MVSTAEQHSKISKRYDKLADGLQQSGTGRRDALNEIAQG
jgi:hypothetical protein